MSQLVFVDLNTAVESRLAMIGRLRDQRPDLEIVGFSHHGDLALRRRARASRRDPGRQQRVDSGGGPAALGRGRNRRIVSGLAVDLDARIRAEVDRTA